MNLRNVDSEQFQNWLILQERCEDQLWWMAHWREQEPSDPDYIGLEEGHDDLKNFIKTIGFIKDGFDYRSEFLRSFVPGWAIWADRTFHDPIWSPITPYFKDAARLAALAEENEPTRVKALFGIRIGIPEYHYTLWCQDAAQQQTARVVAG